MIKAFLQRVARAGQAHVSDGGRWLVRAALLAVVVGAAVLLVGGSAGPARAQAPSCPWMNTSLTPAQRAQKLVAAMNIDQKIAMLSQAQPVWAHYGVAGYVPAQPSLCIPDLVLNDAGQGVGDQEVNTTAFPAPISQSSSWNAALQRQFGQALGWEAWHKGINVQLAPGVEIDRVPLNGRNFEYMSEDPFLAGQGAVAEVRGIQSNPVIATVKHYIANSQETNRMTDSSDIDERTLQEIYAAPYEAAVRQANPGSVMCSYNRINGTYACENPATLNRILKRQFGFQGFVMSDWGGTHSTVVAANAGLDMEMNLTPGTFFTAPLKAAVQAGQVPMARLNDMVLRIVRAMFTFGIFDHPTPAQPGAFGTDVRRPADIALARTISENGTVLLKNQGGVLPLSGSGKKIAVIGPGAGVQGAELFYNGNGSGHIPEFGGKADVVSPLQGITQKALAHGSTVLYADGTSQADAIVAASAADVAVVFVGSADSEGTDRSTLGLSAGNCTLAGCTPSTVDQDQLIAKVAAVNAHTIVVLNTGGPVLMPWLDHIKGLLEAWYPGQEDGNAIASLLFGDVNPSAKLPETFPRSRNDIPTQTAQQYPGVKDAQGVPHSTYSERMLVGYRWYDAKHIAPLFPFGFGLSYTSFAYAHLRVAHSSGGATVARATIEVKNTGRRSGSDVPQLYIAAPASTGEPPKQLKGFARVTLNAGQTRHVSFPIDARALSYWNVQLGGWRVAPGCYGILIGHDERTISQRVVIAVDGARCAGAVAHVVTRANGQGCGAPTGRLAGNRLDAVVLGRTRAQTRRAFRRFTVRGRRDMDIFCLAGGAGIRVGYPSSKLLRSLSRAERRRVTSRAVLALTSSRHFALGAVRPGERLASAKRARRLGPAFRIGLNTWYLTANGISKGVLKVRHGRVQEIGIADKRLTKTRRAARRFLGSF